MSKASTKAKQKWNEAHYSQIKVSVPKSIAEMYRSKCVDMGISMASDIIGHMTGEIIIKKSAPVFPVENRKKRRESTKKLIAMLTEVRDAEERYMNNIPQNLHDGERYESAEHAVETLDAIIDLASEIY